LACDFFTVETLFLQTIYVLIFIEIGSRRVHFAGCTAHPNNAWVTQQARQVMWRWKVVNLLCFAGAIVPWKAPARLENQ